MAETSKQPTVVLASAAQMLSDSPEPPFTIQGWSESKFQRDGMFSRITNEVFKKESLDRKLDRRHITGIAFSGFVGIGIYQTSAEILAASGPVGALLAYIFAALVAFSVLRCLAEMASVRPVTGALMDFPEKFVDEALGFAVGIMYWLANCMSMVVLTIASVMFTQFWDSSLTIASATFVMLLVLFLMNACGVRIYGNLEWGFKWCKILLLTGLCILMIAIKAGVGPGKVDSKYEISPGFNSTGFFKSTDSVGFDPASVAIPGTGGRFLAVWTSATLAMFQFMGGEIALVAAGEAKRPRRDLPTAARYMYLLPIGFNIVSILLVGMNINYLDPRIYHSHVSYFSDARLAGVQTAQRSPFVIAIQNAGLEVLPGFLDACFMLSALTAANSALYVSSRTLFVIARKSRYKKIRSTLGRTNNGHTPLAAISVSFLPGLLAFLAIKSRVTSFEEPIHVIGRLYTGPMLCIYGAECAAFLKFMRSMSFFEDLIKRDSDLYKQNHYRGHWQPFWAILGLVLCSLLMIFSGWSAIFDLARGSKDVKREDSIVDLIASYLGPILFFCIYGGYRIKFGVRLKTLREMRYLWFPKDVPDGAELEQRLRRPSNVRKGRIYRILRWLI